MKRMALVASLLALALVARADILTRPMGGTFPGGGDPPLGTSSLLGGLIAAWTFDGGTENGPGSDPTNPGFSGYDSVTGPTGGARSWRLVGTGADDEIGGKRGNYITSRSLGASGFTLTSTDFRMSGDFTVSWWGRSQTAFDFSHAFDWFAVTGDYRLRNPDGSGLNNMIFEAFDSVAGSVTVGWTSTTVFHNYIVSYDSSTKKLTLIDNCGAPSTSAALANGLKQASTSLQMMQLNSDTYRMDELYVWARLLTSAEKGIVCGGTSGSFYPF